MSCHSLIVVFRDDTARNECVGCAKCRTEDTAYAVVVMCAQISQLHVSCILLGELFDQDPGSLQIKVIRYVSKTNNIVTAHSVYVIANCLALSTACQSHEMFDWIYALCVARLFRVVLPGKEGCLITAPLMACLSTIVVRSLPFQVIGDKVLKEEIRFPLSVSYRARSRPLHVICVRAK